MKKEEIKKLINEKKLKEANKVLLEQLKENKDDHELWFLKAVCSTMLENYEEAAHCFLEALFLNPCDDYKKGLGVCLLHTRNYEDALREFLSVSDTECTMYAGVCAMFMGDEELAEKCFKKAFDIDKNKAKSFIETFNTEIVEKHPQCEVFFRKIVKACGCKI